MKAFPKSVETLQRDRAMSKDTGELIFKKSINLCCQHIFRYISSFVIAPNAPFSQSLSHICPIVFMHMYIFCLESRMVLEAVDMAVGVSYWSHPPGHPLCSHCLV